MRISETLLPEFEHEAENTRKVLERVPDAAWDYRPHPKSFTMGALAAHLAHIPQYATFIMDTDQLDVAVGAEGMHMPKAANVIDCLDLHADSVIKAREAIGGASDEHMLQPWSLLFQGKVIFTLPRVATVRSMIFNHIYHHRGQLTVYLRLNDVPLPAIYGPSADEQGM